MIITGSGRAELGAAGKPCPQPSVERPMPTNVGPSPWTSGPRFIDPHVSEGRP